MVLARLAMVLTLEERERVNRDSPLMSVCDVVDGHRVVLREDADPN